MNLRSISQDLLILCMSYLKIEEQYTFLQINKSIQYVYPTVYTFPRDDRPKDDRSEGRPPPSSKQYVQELFLHNEPVDYRLFPNLRQLHMTERLYPIPFLLKELTLTYISIPIVNLRSTNLIKLTMNRCSLLHLELPPSLQIIELFNNSIAETTVFHEGLIEIGVTNWKCEPCYTLPLPLSLKRLRIESSTITEINIPTGCALESLNCSWCPEIVSLENLPPTLTELNCAYNYQLKNIDLTGVRLTSLNCSECPINELNLPSTLEKLYCYECLSLVLCKLPYGLKELWVDGNHTTAIDLKRLPDGLTDLILYGTNLKLTCPKGLKRLWCSKQTKTSLEIPTRGDLEIIVFDSGEDSDSYSSSDDSDYYL